MTVITLQGLESALGEAEPLKTGRVIAEPWAGKSGHVRVNGAVVEFPREVRVQIVDGALVAPLDLVALDVPWRLRVEDTVRNRALTRYVMVPASGPVDFADLVDVDPLTFEPTGQIVAAWEVVRAEVAAIRDEVAGMAVTATIDPEDDDVLLITFPSFMTDPDDDLILVLPIGV